MFSKASCTVRSLENISFGSFMQNQCFSYHDYIITKKINYYFFAELCIMPPKSLVYPESPQDASPLAPLSMCVNLDSTAVGQPPCPPAWHLPPAHLICLFTPSVVSLLFWKIKISIPIS